MSVWLAPMLVPLLLLAPPSAAEKLDARMLLDLDLLSDEHFEDHAGRDHRAGVARDSEMLDDFDWLNDDASDDSSGTKTERRRR